MRAAGLVIVVILALSISGNVYGQKSLDSAYATIQTTKIVLSYAEEQIGNGNFEQAQEPAKIATVLFANDLTTIREIDQEIADETHLLLLDLSQSLTSKGKDPAQLIGEIITKLDSLSTSDLQTDIVISELLTIADEQYQKSSIDDDDSSYTLSLFLFKEAHRLFQTEVDSSTRLGKEMNSFFDDLLSQVQNKDNFVNVGKITSALQRDLVGSENIVFDEQNLYGVIRQLYSQMLDYVDQGNYETAEELAIEAYLENFEYLEPTLEEVDPQLLSDLEVDMREELRQMIKNRQDATRIRIFVEDSILPRLDLAESQVADYLKSDTSNQAFAASDSLKKMGDAPDDQKAVVRNKIDVIRDDLKAVEEYYRAGDHRSAYATARSAYLDSYESIEIPLRPIDPDFTLEVEYNFANLRNSIKEGAPLEEIQQTIIAIKRNLDESERLVSGTGVIAPAIAFSASFAIIFREGLESVLILGAILTYLEASRNTKFKAYVYYGVIIAIGATAVTWAIASYVVDISGASKELIEAIAALSATGVLFYVSFWILNKIEHKKWMEFIKAKVWQATTTGGVMVFVMLSFFTVYREGFETVLFYQAMYGFAKYMEAYVGVGFVLGIASLMGIYFLMRRLGKRLPLRILFGLTMGIGAYLSIAFLGNAIRELQVLDIVPYTSMIGIIPRLDINMAYMTGIYPTLETLIGQIILLGIYLVASSYVLIITPRKQKRISQMRKTWRVEDVKQKN